MPPRFRNVCFTLNNPTELLQFEPEKMTYLVYQEEFGESGTYHLQGYCEFKCQTALSTIKTLLGGQPHIEARRGTAAEASAYCKKEETRAPGSEVFEEGTISQPPGKRNDLISFKDDVLRGKKKRQLLDDHLSTLARYPKLYDMINGLTRPEREEGVEVYLLIGPTGTGKTRYVMDKYKGNDEFYTQPLSNGTTWYDNYDGHKYVLIDDFAGAASHMTLSTLLQILDRYACQVPTKGSHTWFHPHKVYVTTNILPKDWYKWEKRETQYAALARRFTTTLLFEKDEEMKEAPADWWDDNAPHGAAPFNPFPNGPPL